MSLSRVLVLVTSAVSALAQCPDYAAYSKVPHPPLSGGRFRLPYQRPEPACRTFNVSEVEETINSMRSVIQDPDLFRLFENTLPNTLDSTISWKGFASGSDEELTFITTGDIVAMWLRDSANQLRSYKPLLQANSSPNSLSSLYRGAINLQARYIVTSPHCNAFQAPVESGIRPGKNGAAETDRVVPAYDKDFVFECKYELDSLAAFLQLSHDYYQMTRDIDFFGRYSWVKAVNTIVNTTKALLVGTYDEDGRVLSSPYSFQRTTTSASETLMNQGVGHPVNGGTGLVRSAFRPSDDSTMYQLFIPANMMFSSYLGLCSEIMQKHDAGFARVMNDFASSIRRGIEEHGKISHAAYGDMYAYEIDGFGSTLLMDDANVPSLLGAPIIDYVAANDSTYQNTRRFVLSTGNPYYMHGQAIRGVGGPHQGPGMAWPMSVIVALLSSEDEPEIISGLHMLLNSTGGLALIHESVSTFNASQWTRQWFSWANGLFGQLILHLNATKPQVLGMSYQL